MSVAELSIKRPVTTIMFFASLLVIGLIAAVRLPLEAFPEVSPPFIFVSLPYAGSTPEEVERTVLRPAEEALATMTGIKRIDANARSDGAQIFMQFSDWSRDVAIAASDARERLDAIRDELPDDLKRWQVLKFSTTDQPVLRVRLASKQNLNDAYDMIDREFKRRLERIPGVARVDVSGAPKTEVEIAIQPDRLSAHQISINDLSTRLQAVNFSVSAGEIDDGGQRLRVQPVGEITDLQQLRDLVVARDGTRLGDIADVRLKPGEMDTGRRLDGERAVGLDIFKERNANLVQVSRDALAEVNAIRKQPQLSDIQTKIIENQGEDVTTSLSELAEAGGIGLLLSIIVLYFFLRHWPSTAMVTLAIPICFVMTLGFMYFAGVTLNILSMMGLLAVGMLVDNAVVVVSLIPMLSARLKTPPAVRDPNGLIPRLQRRYASLLRWTLEHRGWSVTGIVLIIAISCVPMVLTKKNMFGGDDGGETNIFYQWKGSYTKEQMSAEILRVEQYLDANRKKYHLTQIYSWWSEQGDAGTRITFDTKEASRTRPIIEQLRKDLPKSARAEIGIGNDGGGPGGGPPGENVQVQLVGDSTQVLTALGNDIVPILARRKELRDVRVDAGDQNSELNVQVDRERAAAFGFSAQQVASFVGIALRGAPLREFRRGDNEVPVWVRFAGAQQYRVEDLSSFMVRAPDGRS